MAEGCAVSIELCTCGEVPDKYVEVVQSFADGLADLAEAGFIELRDHSTGDLSDAISKIWYGTPSEVDGERQLHAWRLAKELMAAAGVPESGMNLIREAGEQLGDAAVTADQRNSFQVNVPDDVRTALTRMCTPLDQSLLSGATAREDGRCMSIIKSFIDRLEFGANTDAPCGAGPAEQFWNELLQEFDSLTAIADVHGSATLADCMYLQNAILTGGFIDNDGPDAESKIVNLVKSLPSNEKWIGFIHVN